MQGIDVPIQFGDPLAEFGSDVYRCLGRFGKCLQKLQIKRIGKQANLFQVCDLVGFSHVITRFFAFRLDYT